MWSKKGIVNGCTAVIKDIIYPENKKLGELPDVIIVYIPQYIGPQFFTDINRKNWIPISISLKPRMEEELRLDNLNQNTKIKFEIFLR